MHALLVDGNVLKQGDIDVFKAGSVDLIAAQIAIGAVSRYGKAAGVEVLGEGIRLD